MITEQEMRELAGVPAEPEISFLGEPHKIREDGLAALLRYAGAGADGDGMAAAHRLLEDCLIDFPAFAAAALEGKAEAEDIQAAVRQLTEFYCARKYWPAMRLIGYVADKLAEMDGQLIRASALGIASLSAREACNLALAVCLDGLSGDDRELFFEDLEYEGNPEADAMEKVRQMQADAAARAEAADG